MAHPGTAHKYSKKLIAFEHGAPTPPPSPPNTLLWIGGLGDGLLTVHYPSTLAASLPPTWVLAEVLLRSSYNGWTTGRLSRDARELNECITYFRSLRPNTRIVLMGHSTGCQDIMEYLVGPDAHNHAAIDGAVLQGAVSDREAWADMCASEQRRGELDAVVDEAQRMVDGGDEKGVLQIRGNGVASELGAGITAYRALSLLTKGGDDDYFSEDLGDEHFAKTFGVVGDKASMCFLLGAEDPYVPARIDRAALLARWTRIVREGGGVVDDVNGGVVPGAHHNLNDDPEEVVQDLVNRVVRFVQGLEKSADSDVP